MPGFGTALEQDRAQLAALRRAALRRTGSGARFRRRGRPMRGFRALCLAAAVFAGAGAPASGRAHELPPPTGPVILVVTGAIHNTNAPGEARFDGAMLEALGMSRVVTGTPWHDREVAFEGPLARALIERVGTDGTVATGVALNDYKADIPLADFAETDVMLAMKEDGRVLTIRDKGPIWIIYPRGRGETDSPVETRAKMIWQLKSLIIR